MLDNYNDVLTVHDLQEIFHIGRNTAYKLLKEKEIPSVYVGNKYIIPKDGVIHYLSSCLRSA